MTSIIVVSTLSKGIRGTFLIILILLLRKKLNVISFRRANWFLWMLLFAYLIVPYEVFCRIQVSEATLPRLLLSPLLLMHEFGQTIERVLGGILSKMNRLVVASLMVAYTFLQIRKRNKAMAGASILNEDSRIEKVVKQFHLRRKVTLLINDDINVPVTYGVLYPKIVLQNQVLEDNTLLQHVLMHELIHIRNFDMVWKHLKNLIICFYWFNPIIWAALRYMEEDIEILCDKLVIQNIGDSVSHRKQYCNSMLNLLGKKDYLAEGMKFHPTMERMIVMKQWHATRIGTYVFLFVFLISSTAFAEVSQVDKHQVVSIVKPVEDLSRENSRVRLISEEEYNNLHLSRVFFTEIRAANIDSSNTLKGLAYQSYQFNMDSWTGSKHEGFTVKMSNMKCTDGLKYSLIIKENDNTIYNERFNKPTILAVNADNNSVYEVIVKNDSTYSLTYQIKINSYRK